MGKSVAGRAVAMQAGGWQGSGASGREGSPVCCKWPLHVAGTLQPCIHLCLQQRKGTLVNILQRQKELGSDISLCRSEGMGSGSGYNKHILRTEEALVGVDCGPRRL